jgi:hypothetical protein
MRSRMSLSAFIVLASMGAAWAGDLPVEVEPNDSLGTANDASENFVAVTGNLFHMGISGLIADGSDTDYFNIGSLQAGDVLTVAQYGLFSNRGTNADTEVHLYRAGTMSAVVQDDDSGPPAAPGGDALLWRFAITTTDTYYVRAHRFQVGDIGTYQLGLYLENAGAAPITGGSVVAEGSTFNNSVATADNASSSWRAVQYRAVTTAAITAGDADLFAFHWTAGDRISVTVDSTSALDASVKLRNASGTIVGSEDGSSLGPLADSPMYAFVIPATGTYVVEVAAAAGTGTYDLIVELSGTAPPVPAFVHLGSGLAGVNGVPDLSGSGTLAAGTTGSLSLSSAAPSSPAVLFVSVASAPVPFKGGVLTAFPSTLLVPLATIGSGGVFLSFTWPSGVPSATALYFQYAIHDVAAPFGVSLSNALKGVTP